MKASCSGPRKRRRSAQASSHFTELRRVQRWRFLITRGILRRLAGGETRKIHFCQLGSLRGSAVSDEIPGRRPCAYINTGERSFLLLSDLEIDRGKRVAAVDEVLSLSELEKNRAGRERREAVAGEGSRATHRGSRDAEGDGAAGFPLRAGASAAEGKDQAEAREGGICSRAADPKTPAEIKAMSAALRITEAGFARAIEALKATTIRQDNTLMWHRKVLTSELLRVEIESAILRAGGEARGDSIVAGGEQACRSARARVGAAEGERTDHSRYLPARCEERVLWRHDAHGSFAARRAMRSGICGRRVSRGRRWLSKQ